MGAGGEQGGMGSTVGEGRQLRSRSQNLAQAGGGMHLNVTPLHTHCSAIPSPTTVPPLPSVSNFESAGAKAPLGAITLGSSDRPAGAGGIVLDEAGAADYFWEELVAGGGAGGGGMELVGGGLQLTASQSGGQLGSQVRGGHLGVYLGAFWGVGRGEARKGGRRWVVLITFGRSWWLVVLVGRVVGWSWLGAGCS
jgi:hypothetical protein